MTEVKTKPRKLRPRQQRFVDEYLKNGGNATQAADKAGYNATADVMRSIACENLTKPNIINAIEAVKAKIEVRNELCIDEVIANARKCVEIGLKNDNAADIARGNEQLSRYIGAFKDTGAGAQVNVQVNTVLSAEQERLQLENRLNLLKNKDNAGNGVI